MNRENDNENTLGALRELPSEVSLDQVQHMVAAFPIAVGLTAWLAALKFHLNSIIMTTTGTIIVGTGAYLLNVATPAPKTEATHRIEPTVTVEMPVTEMLEEPAVVLEAPVQKKQEQPSQEEPNQACMVWPGDSTTATTETKVYTVTTYPGATPYPGAAPYPGAVPAEPEPAMEPWAGVQGMPAVVYRPSNERAFDLRGFNGVALRGSMNVTLKQGDHSVTATGDQGLLDRLRATVENGVLRLEFEKDKYKKRDNWSGTVNVAVAMPNIRDLSVYGSGTIASGRFTRADELDLRVMGSGDIFLDGVAEVSALNILLEGSGDILCGEAKVLGNTRINLTGSGDVKVTGTTATIDVDIVGSGDLAAAEMKSGGGKVHIMGSGDAFVNSEGKLDLKVTGSGTIHTSGSAGLKGSRGVGTGTE